MPHPLLHSLEAVLDHPAVWRGSDCARVTVPSVSTGFPELDAALPGGGWPAAALTEIYAERAGAGEMQLVMPAVAHLTRAGRWAALIAPPHVPYAPALAAHGVKLSRLILVRVADAGERFWACEQVLRHPGCGAVLVWADRVPERALRRMQLAAEDGSAIALLFRSPHVIPVSTAALRLHVGRAQSRTVVRVLKRRGSDLPLPITLDPYRPPAAPARTRGPGTSLLEAIA